MTITFQKLFDYCSKPTNLSNNTNTTTNYRGLQTSTTTTTILTTTTTTTTRRPHHIINSVWNDRHLTVRCLSTNNNTSESPSSSQSEESEEEEPIEAAPHLHDLAQEIILMNMMEVKELVDRVAIHFDITPEEDETIGSTTTNEEAVVAQEEKTSFDIKLQSFDAKSKIKIIKEVRAITKLGLKESKALVEGAPKVITQDISKEEAEQLKEKLESLGAIIEIV